MLILGIRVAGDDGFEPSLPDPESGVLPLDESPKLMRSKRH